jgi:hypothetical protein
VGRSVVPAAPAPAVHRRGLRDRVGDRPGQPLHRRRVAHEQADPHHQGGDQEDVLDAGLATAHMNQATDAGVTCLDVRVANRSRTCGNAKGMPPLEKRRYRQRRAPGGEFNGVRSLSELAVEEKPRVAVDDSFQSGCQHLGRVLGI